MNGNHWTRRDFLRRSAATGAAAAVGGPVLLGACSRTGTGADVLQTARDQGYITIGIADEEPYGFREGGKVTGEAPEVARAIMDELGVPELRAELTEFKGLIPGLNAGHFDLVAAGMYITPERCRQADFSVPDYQAPTALLVPSGNPKGLGSFQDVADSDASVAVMGGAQEEEYAKKSGVPPSRISTFGDQLGLLQAVTDERVYCAALTNISLNTLVESHPDAAVEVTEGFNPVIDGEPVIQCGGFTFRPGSDDFRNRFSERLTELQNSGEWVQIVQPFGFGEDNLPPEGVTTQQLCGGETASPSPTG